MQAHCKSRTKTCLPLALWLKRAKELEKEIDDIEDVLKERKEQQRKLLEDTNPRDAL